MVSIENIKYKLEEANKIHTQTELASITHALQSLAKTISRSSFFILQLFQEKASLIFAEKPFSFW